MRKSFWVVLACAAAVAATMQPAAGGQAPKPHDGVEIAGQRTEITFHTRTAPCNFAETQALTDEYASVGVHFRGPADSEGGAILNQCGVFGIGARSGREFLAFNSLTYSKVPETISFDDPVRRVACFVADGSPGGPATYWLIAKRGGSVVATTKVKATTLAYTGLQVRADGGIDTVVLKASTPDADTFVLDDLSFVPLV